MAEGTAVDQGVAFAFVGGPDPEGTWDVRSFELVEGVSELYSAVIDIEADPPVAPEDLLGQPCTLSVQRPPGAVRRVHGVVESVQRGQVLNNRVQATVTLVPALRALQLTRDSRIFEKQTVPAVLEAVLREGLPFGREVDLEQLSNREDFPEREYVVQYRESNYDFVLRLMAEEGLWFYFDHEQNPGLETLVIVGGNASAPEMGDSEPVPLSATRKASGHDPAVDSFHALHAMHSTDLHLRHFDWTKPDAPLKKEGAVEAAWPALVVYEHDGLIASDYADEQFGEHDLEYKATIRQQLLRTYAHSYEATANMVEVEAGRVLKLRGHPLEGFDGDFLIAAAQHRGDAVSVAGEASPSGSWNSTFQCIPHAQEFRPAQLPKPHIAGIQTAVVVDAGKGVQAPTSGEEGADIDTDPHGRIRVKFPWDRTEAGSEGTATCYVRVSQLWAGHQWGVQFIPRAGMEVVVAFVEGDPDKPLVTGCVYNGANRPPYAATPTQSGIKTASSVDPSRYNELRFEDALNKEEIFIHAQRNATRQVVVDDSESVGGNQNITVTGHRSKTVGGDDDNGEESHIRGDRVETVSKNEEVTITETRTLKVDSNETRTIGGTRTMKVTGATTEDHDGGRKVNVKEFDVENVTGGAHKNVHVTGQYNITADEHFKVKQGADQLFIKDSGFWESAGDIQLKNGGCHVTLGKDGKLSIDASKELAITVGGATLSMKSDGTISLAGKNVSMESGANSVVCDPKGTTVSGTKISSSAVGIHELQGAVIKIG